MDDKSFEIRPRFYYDSQESVEEICNRFKSRLSEVNCPFEGKVRIGYISIYPRKEEKHYWSPHLSITLDENEDASGCNLSGLYGPSPPVWTLFIFVYSVLLLLITIVAVIGLANISINESGLVLWALPALILVLVSMYLVSYFGQKKGHDQIEMIHEFFLKHVSEDSIDE